MPVSEKEVEDSSSEITEDYNYIESEDLYFIPAVVQLVLMQRVFQPQAVPQEPLPSQ